MTELVWLVVGAALGAVGYHLFLASAPGRLVETHQTALLTGRRGTVQLDGPRQLSRRQGRGLVGVYDLSDKRLDVLVDPVFAPRRARRGEPELSSTAEPDRQRFFLEMAVVYRPRDMVAVLRLGEDLEDWLASHVRAAVRAHALTRWWDPHDDGEQFSVAVRQRLQPRQQHRGIELVEVYCERVGVLTAGELESRAKGASARTLGRDGLLLTYLDALREVAGSASTKILLPSELASDAEALLRATRAGATWASGPGVVDLTDATRSSASERSAVHDVHADDAHGAP